MKVPLERIERPTLAFLYRVRVPRSATELKRLCLHSCWRPLALPCSKCHEPRQSYVQNKVQVAERSKAPVSGTGLFGGEGSNPFLDIIFFIFAFPSSVLAYLAALACWGGGFVYCPLCSIWAHCRQKKRKAMLQSALKRRIWGRKKVSLRAFFFSEQKMLLGVFFFSRRTGTKLARNARKESR